MADSHIYVLIEQPSQLRDWEWKAVLRHLYRVWNRWMAQDEETGQWVESLPTDIQPSHRLHYRCNPDKSRCIVEALFVEADLDIEDLTRLPAYIATALNAANQNPPAIGQDEDGNPIYDEARCYTAAQVRAGMCDHITLWPGEWGISGDMAREFLKGHPVGWSGIGAVILAPADITGIPKPDVGEYTHLIDLGDYSLWSAEADAETLLDLHNLLWEMVPVHALGVLAVVDEFGTSFYPSKVRNATEMSGDEALARRDRIANYLDGLGCDTTLLRAAMNEHQQVVGIVDALGHDMHDLWRAM